MSHEQRLQWNDSWRRSNWVDYSTTAVTTAAALTLQFGVEKPDRPSWTGPILFDKGAQNATLLSSRSDRTAATRVGDIFFYLPQALPFIDGLVTPLATDDNNGDIAWELTMMNIQATSLTLALVRSGHRFVGRARPDVALCKEDPEFSADCNSGPYSSFPSGHTAAAFTGAGLMCAHHGNLPLWGHPVADTAACVSTVAMGFASGASRLMAGRHYASDVIVGALVGFGVGFGMPTLLHYKPLGGGETATISWVPHPTTLDGSGLGLGATGTF